MVKISLFDNKSYVFFNITLFDLLFEFNGGVYNSVNDCFNSNKFINNWNPNDIPSQQRINILADGFLFDGDCKCFVRGDVSVKQFELYVKSYLFCKYYEQVPYKTKEQCELKYGEAYKACSYVISNMSVDVNIISWFPYKTDIEDDEINLYINKNIKEFQLHSVKIVNVSVSSLSVLTNPKKLIASNKNVYFNIYVESESDETSFVLFLCKDLDNVCVINQHIPVNSKLKNLLIGSMKRDIKIDWNNTILMDWI